MLLEKFILNWISFALMCRPYYAALMDNLLFAEVDIMEAMTHHNTLCLSLSSYKEPEYSQ